MKDVPAICRTFLLQDGQGGSMNYFQHFVSDFTPGIRVSKLPMVYIITTGDFQYMKIGKTKSFKQRLNNIQSGCPFKLSLWLSIRTPKSDEIEKFLLKKMSHVNTRGEWFTPGAKDLDYLSGFVNSTNSNIREEYSALL